MRPTRTNPSQQLRRNRDLFEDGQIFRAPLIFRLLGFTAVLLSAACTAGVVYVIVHFLGKVW